MPLKNINYSKNIFWILVLFIWIISTFVDRIWWNFFSNSPSWDQADYLNSAIDHARVLSFLDGGDSFRIKSLLDLSPKIPPLASIVNGAVIGFAGALPHKAAWSLSIWNGFLIFNLASWGLYLKGRKYSIFCVLISSLSPFVFDLRTDYVLEMPLIASTTFYLLHLGKWSDPFKGGKWIQIIIASIACSASLLIKQSSLLVILPSLIFIFFLSLTRDIRFRCQFLYLCLFNIIAISPWFYHNWIMVLSGSYRAIFESAAIEGDPSIFDLKSIFWYFPFLNVQFGSIIFFVGISGLVFILLNNIRSFTLYINLKYIFNTKNYKWTWVCFNLVSSWTFTTFIPNKDVRYIACTIPLITLLLALGFCKWNDWIYSHFKLKIFRLFLFSPLCFSISPLLNNFSTFQTSQKKYYPINEIIYEINLIRQSDVKDTIIVVPSTPEVNQHNVSYFGKIKDGNILGRQLGQSLLHRKPVLDQANWIILADGDQGSVPTNSLALDKAIRTSGVFDEIRQFPREEGGNYSLWKRNSSAPKLTDFHKRFVQLANGMDDGYLGIKLIFDEISIQHMIDGHFKYQTTVNDEALSKIISNPNDIEALWTLSLLKILSNRPSEADIYLESLEELLPDNPWPSTYRSIVNLASLKPWKASKIADSANEIHKNYLLKSLGDIGAVLGGSFWRLPSTLKSVPKAIENIDQIGKTNHS